MIKDNIFLYTTLTGVINCRLDNPIKAVFVYGRKKYALPLLLVE